MKKAWLVTLALAVVFSLLVAGCGTNGKSNSSPTQSSGKGSEAGKQIEITFWAGTGFKDVEGYDSKNYGDWEKVKAKEFQKLHPNVKINVEVVPFKDIEQKVNVAIAGNNPPDILFDNVPLRVVKHARNGLLEDLEDVIKDDRDDWKKDFLDIGSYDGKVYALPIKSQPDIFILNKTLFEEKGAADLLPKNRLWNWTEMKEALKKVADKDTYGIAYFAKNEQADQLMISSIMSSGAQWANNDFSKYLLNSPQAVEALTMMIGLADEKLAAPGTASMQVNDTIDLFLQGKLAVLHFMPNMYGTIAAGKKDGSVVSTVEPYGVIPVTKEGTTPRLFVTSEEGYGLFKQSDPEKRKMAIEFLKMLTATDDMKAINKSTFSTPARKSAAYKIDDKDFAEVSKVMDTLELVNLGKTMPYYSELRQKLYPEIQAAFLKAKTPKQALDDFVKNANELSAKAKK